MLHKYVFANIPLLPVTTAFVAGIIAGLYFYSIAWTAVIIMIAVALIIARRYYPAVMTAAIAIGFCNSGINSDTSYIEPFTSSTRTYSAIIEEVKENDTSQTAVIKINQCGNGIATMKDCYKFRAAITIPGFSPQLNESDVIVFKAEFSPPANRTDLPDEVDYRAILRSKGIVLQSLITDSDIYSVSEGKGFKALAIQFRHRITTLLYRSPLHTKTKEFINALLTGDTSDIPRDMRQRFMSAGISHILALSGLHVGIIAMILSVALWPIYALGQQKLRIILIMAMLWFFVFITGFSPSATRAVIMASVMMSAHILQRRVSPVNSLCFAALIILAVDPLSITTIGFQLTFAAVAAIILFSNALNPIPRQHRILYNIVSYITVSVSAMIGTGLISAIYFHCIPVYFLLANISVTIFLPFIISCGILLVIIEASGFDSQWLCIVLDRLYIIIDSVALWVTELPGAAINHIYIPAWYMLPYTVTIITLKLLLEKRTIFYGTLFASCTAITITLIATTPGPERKPALFASRDTYNTCLTIDDGSNILHILTMNPQEISAIRQRAEWRYADYMGHRNIDSLTIHAASKGRNDTTISFCGHTVTLLSGSPEIKPHSVNYLMVCRGTRADISEIAQAYRPDSIILSTDLDVRRERKYAAGCDELGIPYISLRMQGWSLRCDSDSNR